MYSQEDMAVINGKLRRNALALGPVLAALLAAYIYALSARVQWLALVAGPLLFVAACYGVVAYLWPNLRYKRFLEDMAGGLSREVRGTIVEISETAELQDGAMVLPVKIRLDPDAARESAPGSAAARRLQLESHEDTEDERIVYLNASKREGFPKAGTAVRLECFGRHVTNVALEAQPAE